jgi:peptidoglycan/LPS O-acetylase OafA/YrhL
LTYGHFSVAMFIVLSGYCLMLPVARSTDGRLAGGFWGYLKRRARRILPPYYAAVALSLAFIAAIPSLREPTGTIWDGTTPAFTPGPLLSHLLLVHNLSDDWIHRINGPLWSVATEWQIYFLFPLMMLPVWRRFGTVAMVVVSFAVGLLPHFALGGLLEKTYPWYVGLFALGGAAAAVNFSPDERVRRFRDAVPWPALTTVLWIATAVVGFGWARFWWAHLWFADTVLGVATACLLVRCTNAASRGDRPISLRVFESRAALLVGRFSYSLYLVHMPVLVVIYLASRAMPAGLSRWFLMQASMVPCSLAASYVFYLAFERPTRSAKKSEPAYAGVRP